MAEFRYSARRVPCDPQIGTIAYEIRRRGESALLYHVHRTIHGEVKCTCGDFVFRRVGTGTMCKHGRLLVERGLIEPTTVSIRKPFSRNTLTQETDDR